MSKYRANISGNVGRETKWRQQNKALTLQLHKEVITDSDVINSENLISLQRLTKTNEVKARKYWLHLKMHCLYRCFEEHARKEV